ncbi:hypothetical protein FWN93_13815 [Salmonella enterica]|uniref:YbaK/aminoacyl-tRNA synthetase-associated domain-containing protein n=1 Tax=Salmonella enterica TaxID=28901 RepID=A0A5U0MQW6_SALER|nr:hypothetical protein [Salmonella enterica]EBO4490626.1 hypothetical protein [Salmonella enterica]EEA6348635.1 hypothetical protein [Salmonella enterica]
MYNPVSYPEVKTVADHASFAADFSAQLLKNLLLKNSSDKHFYLYILDGNKRADLRELALQLNESRLSLAKPDELIEILVGLRLALLHITRRGRLELLSILLYQRVSYWVFTL